MSHVPKLATCKSSQSIKLSNHGGRLFEHYIKKSEDVEISYVNIEKI